MKYIIIKYRNSIIALLLTLVFGSAVSAAEPWTVSPGDYRYDMSLYVDMEFASGKMDYSQYDVAVFCGSECRGVAERLALPDGSECLYLRARSNSESGETLAYRYRDRATGDVFDVEGVGLPFVSNSLVGMPSAPSVVKIVLYYDVALSAGEGGTVDNVGGRLAEGTQLTVTATPAEGYHFEKWSDGSTDNPREISVAGAGVVLQALFVPNVYNAVFKIDGVPVATVPVEYGQPVSPLPSAPEKEGHTFAGWQDVPSSMPAHDIEVNGDYTVNVYNAVFKIEGVPVATVPLEYGQPVSPLPSAPEKEGYTFAGWQDVPSSMPAHDIEVNGSYTVNVYNAVFKIEGVPVATVPVEYGQPVSPLPSAPEKEGHTFAGWQDIPSSMPAHDIEVNGDYTVNSYRLTVYLDGEVYLERDVPYGEMVDIPSPSVADGRMFDGWDIELPVAMPAHNLDIHGTTSIVVGVRGVVAGCNDRVCVYSIDGALLLKDITAVQATEMLSDGVYIINGRKVIIKR